MAELIFVVDSELGTCLLVQRYLEEAGYAVCSFSAPVVIEEAQNSRPALMLIAAALPDSGLDLCRHIRQNTLLARTPVILLTAAASEDQDYAALQAGATDCLTKPFSAQELINRVQSALARPVHRFPAEGADIVIDRAAMKLSVRGSEVAATTLEFRLVDYLAQHRGHVFTRDVLLDAVWGETQFVTPRSVDACIRRVREKIEPDRTSPTYLKTVRGVGYRFDAIASWPSSGERCTCIACVSSTLRTAQSGLFKRRRAVS
jgi:DNA-binding response OmpR family regulator